MARFRFARALPQLCKQFAGFPGETATSHELAAALRTLAPRRQRAIQLYRAGLTSIGGESIERRWSI